MRLEQRLILLVLIILNGFVTYGNNTIIKGEVKNDSISTIKLSYHYPDVLITEAEILGEARSFMLEFDLVYPSCLELQIGKHKKSIFVKPNDEIEIRINQNDEIEIIGSSDYDIYAFLDFRKTFTEFDSIKHMNVKTEEFESIGKNNEKRAELQLLKLSELTKEKFLSDDYINFEKNNILYQKAMVEFRYLLQYEKKNYKEDDVIGRTSTSGKIGRLLKRLMPKYPTKSPYKNAFSSPEYLNYFNILFMNMYMTGYFPQIKSNQLKLIDEEFKGYFVNSEPAFTSLLLNRYLVDEEDLIILWPKFKPYFNRKEYIDFMDKLVQEKTAAQEQVIVPRERIEKVISENSLDRFNEFLNANKGKLIYVDFFTTWCKPCIMEFPYSAEVYDLIDKDEIAFIYLCTDYKNNEEKWTKLIDKYNLGGTHWFVKNGGLNKSSLNKHYEVNDFPRYLLFDREGNLVDNNAMRPSNKMELLNRFKELGE